MLLEPGAENPAVGMALLVSEQKDLATSELESDAEDSDTGSTGKSTPHTSDPAGYLPEDGAKHAYFDYASEKSLSHAESKLAFRRHQLESSQNEQSPVQRSKTFSSLVGGDLPRSRTVSNASLISGKSDLDRRISRRLSREAYPPDLSASRASLAREALGQPEVEADETAQSTRETAAGHFVSQVSDISPELTSIAHNVRKILRIRHKYIKVSLQDPDSNPRDDAERWRIYPPPPNPIWDENKNRPATGEEDENGLSENWVPGSPVIKRRKAGADIGQDFDIRDVTPAPACDEAIEFGLDQSSVFQIRSLAKGGDTTAKLVDVPTLRDFYRDLNKIQEISSDGPTKSFAYRQLEILEGKFHLYSLVNAYQETMDCKKVPRKDRLPDGKTKLTLKDRS